MLVAYFRWLLFILSYFLCVFSSQVHLSDQVHLHFRQWNIFVGIVSGFFEVQRHHIIGPQHEKTNKMTCAQRLRSAWACPIWSQSSLLAWRNLGSLATHWAQSKDSDQMLKLIWVIPGCTCHFVGFVMLWLICHILSLDETCLIESDTSQISKILM